MALLVVLFPALRLYEIYTFLVSMHTQIGYQSPALVRAIFNTIWHYIEIIIGFGSFYLATALLWSDRFASDGKRTIADGICDSLYFSFVTISTVGYGDFSPQTAIGRLLVMTEVLFGVFLLIIVLQRAFAAGQQLSIEDILGQLDEKCLALMHRFAKADYFASSKPGVFVLDGLDPVISNHALDRLTKLGVLRFDAHFRKLKYAYHWTPLGKEVLDRIGYRKSTEVPTDDMAVTSD